MVVPHRCRLRDEELCERLSGAVRALDERYFCGHSGGPGLCGDPATPLQNSPLRGKSRYNTGENNIEKDGALAARKVLIVEDDSNIAELLHPLSGEGGL